MSDDGFVQHFGSEHFDLESELYTAMAEETEGLGPPELDLDRMRAAGRRRRMVLAGSGAAVALIGVTAAAVAVGGSGGSSGPAAGSSGLPSSGTTSAVKTAVPPNPTGCDGMLKVKPPFFTGSAKPTLPTPPVPSSSKPSPHGPTTPRAVVTTAPNGCRVVMELPPAELSGPVPSGSSYPGVTLLPFGSGGSSGPKSSSSAASSAPSGR